MEVLVAMIEAEFGLFQVQQKGVFGHAFNLLEADFGEAPEGLDAVDVRGALDELILAVAHTKMAVESNVYQPVIPAPAVGVDQGRHVNFTTNNSLQGLFRTVGDDFHVHLPTAFEQAKDNGFAACSTASFAAHPPRAEVAFVKFDGPGQFGRHGIPYPESVAKPQVKRLDGADAQARERAASEAVKSRTKSRSK